MSRAKPTSPAPTVVDSVSVAAFLRGLAARVEADAAFGRQVATALCASGLLAENAAQPSPQPGGGRERRPTGAASDAAGTTAAELPDPFAIWRARGDDGLRGALDELSLADLRRIVRTHRFDPARISARWAVRERLVELVISQVRARMDHGKAFSHI
jgi:hypothetical protein